MSWGELYERARRVATGLAAAGVGSQDRVAFLDKNGIEHFEVVYGAALGNAVCVDVNWRLAPPEVAFIVNDCAAKVLVVGPDFVPVLDAIGDELVHDPLILVIGGHGDHRDYDDWVAGHADVDPQTPSTPDDVALQLYSSGTTGRPKGVMISNHNLIGLLPVGGELWEMTPDSVVLVAMPLFHIGGSGWATVAHFIGARLEILREIDFGELVRLFSTRGVTHAFVVPAVLQFMQLVPGVADADFSSLDVIVYGASPISEEVLAGSIKLARVQVLPGVRPHRDDRGDHPPATVRSRPRRSRPATVCARAESPAQASSCASSTSSPAPTSSSQRFPARSSCAASR